MNLGIVIPIYKPDNHRIENLRFILRHFASLNTQNVYVVEQHSGCEQVREVLQMFRTIKYLNFNIAGNVFNKSILVNSAINQIKHSHIWIYDADVYLDVEFILKHIPEDVDVLRPFEKIIMLNESETDKLKRTNLIYLENREHEGYNSFGKFSILVKRCIFEKVGGYDETFEGWGFQDLDLNNRLPRGCYKGYTTNVGFHMWHPRPSKNFYETNKGKFKSRFQKLKKKKKKKLLK